MTETKQDPSPAFGEIYWEAYSATDVAYVASVRFEELGAPVREAIEAGAQAVAVAAVRRRIGELDAAPPEDDEYRITEAGKAAAGEPAKVIAVTDARGLDHRYEDAGRIDIHDGALVVARDGEDIIAVFAKDHWRRASEEGAETAAGDTAYRNARKLAVALDALRDIRGRYESDERGPSGQGEARRALDRIAALGPSLAELLAGDGDLEDAATPGSGLTEDV